MTDYAAEQAEEIEALSAILMDEFSPLEGPLPAGWPSDCTAYRVLVTPTSGLDAGEAAAAHSKQLDIVFAHTPTYPDEPPLIKPRSVRGLSDAELREVAGVIDEQVEANVGMAMMFAVVSAAQEWLRSHVLEEEGGGVDGGDFAASTSGGGRDLTEEELKLAEERRREEEEAKAAAARALGTAVTAETFEAWRRRFDAEREAQGILFGSVYRGEGEGADAAMSADVEAAAAAAAKRKAGKLTGRAFFQKMDSSSSSSSAAAAVVGDGEGGDEEEEGEETSYPSDEEEAEADRAAREALLREEAGDLFDESSDGEGDDDDDDDLLEELEKKMSTS